ncbi:MAG: serine hydrolase [Mycobacterium leprae]
MRQQRPEVPRIKVVGLQFALVLVAAGLVTGCSVPPRVGAALNNASSSIAGAPLQAPTTTTTAVAPSPSAPVTSSQPATPATPPAPVPVVPTTPASTPAPATPPKTPSTPDMAVLQKQVADYLDQQDGTYGAYIIDLVSGRGVGINQDQPFPAASTFKLPMAMYILDQVEQGKASLDEKLAYTADDYEEGTGTLQDTVSEGDTFTVKQLITLAIEESDNIATNMLLRRYGRTNVFAFEQKMGGKVTMFDEDTVGTTPKEMASYMQQAYGTKVIADSTLRQFLINLLENTAWDSRTAAGVPDGVKVAHKIGTLPGVINDVGLVFAPNRSFIVSVYSINVDEDTAADVIAGVTQKVYKYEEGLAQ